MAARGTGATPRTVSWVFSPGAPRAPIVKWSIAVFTRKRWWGYALGSPARRLIFQRLYFTTDKSLELRSEIYGFLSPYNILVETLFNPSHHPHKSHDHDGWLAHRQNASMLACLQLSARYG